MAGLTATSRFHSVSMARSSRVSRATPLPQRYWRTASAQLAAVSNITGPAASCPLVWKKPMRCSSYPNGNGDLPVVRTTVRPLTDKQQIKSPGGFPSVNFDLGRVLDFTHRLWPAGFYNKIFKWPNWHWFEGGVRRMAGLGHVPAGTDGNSYFHHNLHCDVLIVGAGPAGLAATLSAAKSGARVLLVEQDHEPGGSLLADSKQIDGMDSDQWISQTRSELEDAVNVTVMTSSTVSGYYDHNVLTITDRSTAGVKRFWKVRAKEVVLATGAIEQPLVFDNNDRPGIMLAAAAMEYVNRYAAKPADVMAIATNNDSAYRVAFVLHDKGIRVPVIVDARKNCKRNCTASQ